MTVSTSRVSLRSAVLLTIIMFGLGAPPRAFAQLNSLIVTMSDPDPNSTVGGTIIVSANVTVVGLLTVREVQFTLDGANLGAPDSAAPYAMSWDTRLATNGSHTLRAVARDLLGLPWTSDPVTVTVLNDTTPPTVSIAAPAAGAALAGAVTVSATASDNVGVVGVQFRLDGVALGAEDTSAPYSIPWDTLAASNGSHTLTAVARDAAGNSATSTGVAVVVDNARPTATITAPAGGASVSGTVTVTASASDNIGVVGVRFFANGVQIGAEDTTSPYSIDWNTTTVADGARTLTAVARDAAANTATSPGVTVTVSNATDTIRPTATITAPSSGASVSGTVTVTASASDNVGVVGVRFFADGVQIGGEDTTSPYSIAWDTTTVADGARTLTAVARDAAANTGTSLAVTVTVSNAPPPAPLSATRFENTDVAITYTPGTTGAPDWFHGSRSRDWSNATASFNRSTGARATFRFTGTEVRWIGFRAFWAGIARVYVDDVFHSEVDLFLPPCTPEQRAQGCIDEDDQATVFTATGLTLGQHTLAVEVTGGRNPAATDNAVVVDAFDVMRSPSTTPEGTRSEETASSFTAGWTQGDTTASWSGGSAARSATAGAQAAFAFRGTEVRVLGLRGPANGIARIFLDGSFHAQVDTYSPTAVAGVVFIATGLAPGSHVLTVEVAGAKNAAATGQAIYVDAFDVRVRFEERGSSVTYTGTWVQEHMNFAWSGTAPNTGSGTAALSATAGAIATFTFTGTAVTWIGFRSPLAGIANVYVDDALVAQPDLYAPADQVRVPVFTSANLAAGSHTLKIEATGQRNAAAQAAYVVVDAFDVTLPASVPAVSRVEQTATSVVYTPDTGWTQSSPNNFFSGRTVALSTVPGARTEFTFTGTAVRWIGQHRRDSGIARVYLDGVFIGPVDSFDPIQDEFQAAMFSATGLAPGQHVLTVEVTGDKNPGSSGTMVIVDAFEVY